MVLGGAVLSSQVQVQRWCCLGGAVSSQQSAVRCRCTPCTGEQVQRWSRGGADVVQGQGQVVQVQVQRCSASHVLIGVHMCTGAQVQECRGAGAEVRKCRHAEMVQR